MHNQDNTVRVESPKFTAQNGTSKFSVDLDRKTVNDITDQSIPPFAVGQTVVACCSAYKSGQYVSLREVKVIRMEFEFGRWTVMLHGYSPVSQYECWPDWPTALASVLGNVPEPVQIPLPAMDKVKTAQALAFNAHALLAKESPGKPPLREVKVCLRLLTEAITGK